MATVMKIFLSCLVLVLLATLQTADAFVKPRGERASSAHQGAATRVKHETNQVQTSSIRRPPSGPNPEGNLEVNAASEGVGKRGAQVQNVDTASVPKRELTGAFEGNVASKDVGKHDTHQVQITAVRRPPSVPNPEGNLEVNAVSQDVGKRGTKVQNVDTTSVTKRELTGAFEGNVASKDVGKHDTHQVQITAVRRPPSGPNPEGNLEVNAVSQDVGKRGTKVQNVDTTSVTKRELTGAFEGNVASKDVGKHDTHQVQITAVRRPPSGPNPEGNFEVNAASQGVGKRGTKVQIVDTASVTKDLTGSTQG